MPRPPAPQSLRLFVAVYPPAELAVDLLRRLQRLQLPDSVKITSAEQVHLTLQFIGETPVQRLDEICESALAAGKGIEPFELAPLQIAAWPQSMAVKRILAAETDSPSPLRELHRRLAKRLARNPRQEGSERFVPHMTLARIARPTKFEEALPLDCPAFKVDQYVLMSSDLKSRGAVHKQVQAFSLSGR